ncbi:hypothetical protein BVC80_1837g4 [Macleaya cordata]|uniref:Integrator complex subunit 4/Protein SIEL C-terminal Ig-like domain-containing protein n=1 Tax=Macleaya cordata TaxID=56857 RepID=A0A200R3E8_MACCD|nr:hypothetical protein BVC80_1837g4 [Macleaya cordata]
MEQHVWGKAEHNLTIFTSTVESPDNRHFPCLQSLASIRALIINPSTSENTISLVFETLARSLKQDKKYHLLHHVLNLLSDLAVQHRHLSHVIIDTIRSYALASDDSRLTVQSLAVLLTIADNNQSSAIAELNEDFVLSLCFSSSVSVRSWILFNAFRFQIRPSLLGTVFFRFTKDPYPYVRRAALDGLVGLSKSADIESRGLIEECYDRALDLLLDTNACVRSAAIHVVSEWGQKLAVSDLEVGDRDWFDAVFVQLCTMVRDMSMEVRNEAYLALGKIKLVSEDILLQTQSKKILGITKERKLPGRCTTKKFDLPASNAAGAFVHGLEDEFYEVRRSACNSMGMLISFSVQFANDALNLLMDMLNDDSMVVRLQTLGTMYHMVTCDRLKVQETHMHMFLGTLVDANPLIRSAARNVLRLVKLPIMEIFKSSIDGLLTNLETYPEDEADIFSVLFNMGRNHGKFAVSYVKEMSQEIEPSCEGELSFDNARVAAILVLAISAPLMHKRDLCTIPTRVFSYAVPFLGRISHSIGDVVTQDTLLAYLSQCSRFSPSPDAESSIEDNLFLPVAGGKLPIHNIDEIINQVRPLWQISYGTSEMHFQNNLLNLSQTTSAQVHQRNMTSMHVEAEKSLNIILTAVAETWPFIKSGFTDEVRKTLRSCKEELATVAVDSHGSIGLLAFASQYIWVIQLLAEIWIHFLPLRKFHANRTGMLDLLLEKLDTSLRKLRHGYSGLSKEEELHILELILLACVLRLSKMEICCNHNTLKRLRSTISHVELLYEGESIKPSAFVGELKKSMSEWGSSDDDDALYHQFPFKKLLEFFSLKQVVFGGRIKHIKAELEVPGNNSENPLPFISGLPAGILFQMTLFNISSKDRLWLKMVVEEHCQFLFLGLNQIGGYDEIKNVTLSVPFYRTPKAASFSLRACIGKECPSEDVGHLVKGQGGPKGELTIISNEKETYMVAIKGTQIIGRS